MENTIDASVGAPGLVPVKFTDWESVSGGFLGELEDAQVKLNGPLAQVAGSTATGCCWRRSSRAASA